MKKKLLALPFLITTSFSFGSILISTSILNKDIANKSLETKEAISSSEVIDTLNNSWLDSIPDWSGWLLIGIGALLVIIGIIVVIVSVKKKKNKPTIQPKIISDTSYIEVKTIPTRTGYENNNPNITETISVVKDTK